MFERFTQDARAVVEQAQHEARSLGHDYVGCEHLLLGLFASPTSVAVRALDRQGVRRPELARAVLEVVGPRRDRPDPDALRLLGIDYDEVRRRVEETFGEGALERTRALGGRGHGGPIPFTPRSKKALELALREALSLGHGHIGAEHVLLGILRSPNVGLEALGRMGVDAVSLRRAVLDELGHAAA
jgi:ATP-dependent Clp protease ATP-binding subunit ClpA